jgi:hypothetical protein
MSGGTTETLVFDPLLRCAIARSQSCRRLKRFSWQAGRICAACPAAFSKVAGLHSSEARPRAVIVILACVPDYALST